MSANLPTGEWSSIVVDGMPAPLRELVQEFGDVLVRAFLEAGVAPHRVRHLIHAVWSGPRERRQAPCLSEGRGADRMLAGALAGGYLATPRQLRGFLAAQQQAIVPVYPSSAMLDASLGAMSRTGYVSKVEKHRIRLTEAVRAEMAWQAQR